MRRVVAPSRTSTFIVTSATLPAREVPSIRGMANTPEPNSEDPFSGIPFLGDIAKAMSGQGPINWDAARNLLSSERLVGSRNQM